MMLLLLGLLKLISKLPDSFWYFVSDMLYWPAKSFYRRKVVVSNLKSVFPEKGQEEIDAIADQFYRNFCDLLVELVISLTITKEEMRKRSKFINPEILRQHNSPHQEILMYSIHNGNWEWLALGASAGSEFPCSPIIHVQTSGFADQYMKTVRSRFGGVGIPKKMAPRYVLKNRDKQFNIGILADQSPPQNQPKHWVNFLGRETAFINGLTQLPIFTQLPCYFARFKRVERGRYSFELVQIGDPPYEKGDTSVLKNYLIESEQLIMSDPSQYLWSHKRWKYNREENEELTIL